MFSFQHELESEIAFVEPLKFDFKLVDFTSLIQTEIITNDYTYPLSIYLKPILLIFLFIEDHMVGTTKKEFFF